MKILLFLVVLTVLFSSVLSLVLHCFPRVLKTTFFSLLGISGFGACIAGLSVLITHQNISYQLCSAFPGLSLQFILDPLSGFFLTIIGIIVISISWYGPGYLREYEKDKSIALMSFFTGLFVSGMYLVLLANDVFSFMVAWELMSVSSYFLVAYHHENMANCQSAFLYLLMAQVGSVLILFAFGILIKFSDSGSMNFLDLHFIKISSDWANLAFFLAFFGFGMKTGIIPLHVWLPQAHPVAPSHISALMSGVMLKIAVYGFIRFTFGILGGICCLQWGITVLIFGVISSLLGVLYALMQHNLKRLLAYHSVENIGIIFIGLGLSLIAMKTGNPLLASLGLAAALYHCINHAIFKSLLFLGAGVILQQSREHNLERMGGLIKRMPYTAWCFLIGCISISALPPFNGFISEWLIFQTAFQTSVFLKNEFVIVILIAIAASLLALTAVLAATCFVKVYGVIFLGQERTSNMSQVRDPLFGMCLAMGFLSILCLMFGIFPTIIMSLLSVISLQLIGVQLPNTLDVFWLIPITSKISSYNSIFFLIGILTIGLFSYFLIRICFKRTKISMVNPWDCGFGGINSCMQYTATAFVMPLRRIFKFTWNVIEKTEKINSDISYQLHIQDWIWQYIYIPIEYLSLDVANKLAKLQGGNIRIYLVYEFIILILLLWVVT